ncbi:unnamed protein product [Penicillium nalgiovense]|uniref:Uncharacterized protein n=1 Tax=Penicillium nalgiovense TaxID=60175 RepID=A0A9W4MWS3_PENNA|nr:unnamed protein product [Penicillium nalgiovense]CAG7945871.1 unnamed protein product [Penicillium nalgiovense]CAG7975349.1 unnamed protein product [Penicillium nalgiovense]CAG8054187.1 unnamed protein product [Penicillium nalgiovense]CAG8061972.1 unnamed protein product [Penicillium nalgiovense]
MSLYAHEEDKLRLEWWAELPVLVLLRTYCQQSDGLPFVATPLASPIFVRRYR